MGLFFTDFICLDIWHFINFGDIFPPGGSKPQNNARKLAPHFFTMRNMSVHQTTLSMCQNPLPTGHILWMTPLLSICKVIAYNWFWHVCAANFHILTFFSLWFHTFFFKFSGIIWCRCFIKKSVSGEGDRRLISKVWKERVQSKHNIISCGENWNIWKIFGIRSVYFSRFFFLFPPPYDIKIFSLPCFRHRTFSLPLFCVLASKNLKWLKTDKQLSFPYLE